MYTIAKEFHFSASHQLTTLPPSHPCSRLHGHNYTVQLIVQSFTLNEHGFVMDYGEMEVFGDFLKETVDHRHLNAVLEQPTAERIAHWLHGVARELWPEQTIKVIVSETEKTWAIYE